MADLFRRALLRSVRLAVIHVPPRRKGLTAVAYLERRVRMPGRPMRSRHMSGYLVDLDLSDAVQKSMFFRGTWEPSETALILGALSVGSVFIDVGANAGHYTLMSAAKVGDQGQVHAIEASPAMAQAPRETVRNNGIGNVVSVHGVAVSDVEGELFLQAAPNGEAHAGSRFLDPGATSGEAVRVVRLDWLLKDVGRCDAMKLDIEGADLRALMGAEQLLARCRPQLVLAEADDKLLARYGDSSADMITYMTARGYDYEWLPDEVESPTIIFRLGTSGS